MNHNMRTLKFSYFLYNLVLFFKLIQVVIKKFIKFVLLSKDDQKKRFFWERLGVIPEIMHADSDSKWFWLHANSIGEVNASQALIRLIKDKYPTSRILLTTTNFTADKRAKQLNIANVILFFPYDVPFIINRFLRIFSPTCIIVIECDIWPNFVKICKNRGIPVFIVSGIFTENFSRSLSLRHLYNYKFLLSKDVFKHIDYFCMQTKDDVKKLSQLLPCYSNIGIGGNLKFSAFNGKISPEQRLYYRKLFKLKESTPVFIAGNVHKEECEMIIDAFSLVKEKLPNLMMVLAPRFIEEINQITALLLKKRISYIRKSDLNRKERADEDIILLDSMGELAGIYSIAQAAFVGGSLVYLGDRFGGHNILEPASLNVPVLFGPYMQHFQSLSELFLKHQAAIKVKDARELAYWIVELVTNPEKSQKIINNAMSIFEENRNVEEKTFSLINEKIKN